MSKDPIVIVAAMRTPMGNLLGSLSTLTAPELGSHAIRAAIQQANIQPEQIDEIIMGCVLPAGIGQAPARQTAIAAGIPDSRGATTVNKMCGSGMKALMLAHDAIVAGTNNIMVAGGMESMSNAPYLIAKARSGFRLGHGEIKDHMFIDGLEDAYDKGRLMGYFAEQTATKFDLTREIQDQFAITSLKRAQQATIDGTFNTEITPIKVLNRKIETLVNQDEGPLTAQIEKIPHLRPAFANDGTVTAANSSSISDGAAALILMRRSQAEKLHLPILAQIVAHSSFAQQPAWFTTAPISAIKNVLDKAGWKKDEVDLFEINEAFAVVTLVAMQQLQLAAEKVNIHGGACALGHPIGASGARIIVTLINALKKYQLKRGVASLCIGGGEATAVALEI